MKWKLGLYRGYLCSILFRDTMVPNIEYDYVLLLGYSILYMYIYRDIEHELGTAPPEYQGLGSRGLGFRGLGFRGLGFRGLYSPLIGVI